MLPTDKGAMRVRRVMQRLLRQQEDEVAGKGRPVPQPSTVPHSGAENLVAVGSHTSLIERASGDIKIIYIVLTKYGTSRSDALASG